mgnify:CR=1 FL=1
MKGTLASLAEAWADDFLREKEWWLIINCCDVPFVV